MSDERAPIIIIGAGQAGLQLCDSLRKEGYDGKLLLIGEEDVLPYQRPPLSKQYLSGELTADRLGFRPESFFEKNNIEVMLNRSVTAIDTTSRTIAFDNEILEYSKLGLTTGTRVRLLPVPGGDLEGVHYLRSLDDAAAIKVDIEKAKSLIAIGGGFIGLEIASVAQSMGIAVTVVEALTRLMQRAVSPKVSDYFKQLHEDRGVRVLLNAGVTSIKRADGGFVVRLADDSELSADSVVVGIGAVPNSELAERAGLACDNGIVVDEFAVTSNPDIVAAGDCTMHQNVKLNVRHRLESVQNAVDQAKVAAASLMGNRKPYVQVPWFWSDQFDTKLQMVGTSLGYDEAVVRGDIGEGAFSIFYFQNDRLIGVDSVNQPRDHMLGRKVLNDGIAMNQGQAADAAVDLKALR